MKKIPIRKVTRSQYLLAGKQVRVREDECEWKNGEKTSSCLVLEFPDWANVFALTPDNKLILVKQYRHAIGNYVLELPGGSQEPSDLTPAVTARRELAEETGYTAEQMISLGSLSPNPALNNNRLHMFLATNAEYRTLPSPDDDEDIEVVLCTIDETLQMLKENRLMDNLHVSCIFYALLRLGYMEIGRFI